MIFAWKLPMSVFLLVFHFMRFVNRVYSFPLFLSLTPLLLRSPSSSFLISNTLSSLPHSMEFVSNNTMEFFIRLNAVYTKKEEILLTSKKLWLLLHRFSRFPVISVWRDLIACWRLNVNRKKLQLHHVTADYVTIRIVKRSFVTNAIIRVFVLFGKTWADQDKTKAIAVKQTFSSTLRMRKPWKSICHKKSTQQNKIQIQRSKSKREVWVIQFFLSIDLMAAQLLIKWIRLAKNECYR